MHNIPDFLRITPEMQEHFAKGGLIKRADGHYSKRGLWDNIRANKGSGRKPTKEMLEQEAKIKAEEQYGGQVEEFGSGGYTVKRSNARKGKTHVVIGPDGTKKYFGDSKLGQHPNDPERKKAFYARHKHNLEHNPYFRAYAKATWAYGGFYDEATAAKMQGWRSPIAADTAATTFANGGLTQYQNGTTNVIGPLNSQNQFNTNYNPYSVNPWGTQATANSGQGINTTTPATSPASTNTGTMTATGGSGIGATVEQNVIDWTDPTNMITGQSPNQNLVAQDQTNTDDDFKLPTIMGNEGYGQNIKVGSTQQAAPAAPASTTTVETPEQKAQREKQERYTRARQINRGADLVGLGALGLTKELTNVNPNSQESAVLDFTRQSLDNSINRLAVREANKGIAYGKYGGQLVDKYKDYNEGDVIDGLTPTDRYALEKLGYQFQILNK
jgi:hypothetical protein